MTSKVIREWLAEYKVLSTEEIGSYAASVCHNGELISSLHELFDERPDPEILDPVCHQLFEFHRSSEKELQRFSLELVPSLVWLYLSFLSKGEKSKCGGVEAFLLSVYNLETCNPDGSPKVTTFRIPVLSSHSIYHEPSQLLVGSHSFESTLSGFNARPTVYDDGPHPQYEAVNGQNRHCILAYLLQCYHNNISKLSARSHKMLCNMCSRIVTTGFSNLRCDGDEDDELNRLSTNMEECLHLSMSHIGEMNPRLSVSPALLVDMLTCLYYVMFNGQTGPGARAVMDIHNRACYELYADVLLVTNAIRNSLKETTTGQPEEKPIGLNLTFSPSLSGYTLSKTAITNASFRAKKLPDDIPLQPDESGKLPTITEDETIAKIKSKNRLAKVQKSLEKSRSKETRSSMHISTSNGDVLDSIPTVQSPRDKSKPHLDPMELTTMSKSKDSESNASPHLNKNAPSSSKLVAGIRNSISNKDIKNTKMMAGHNRTSSGGSGGSESMSTDL